MNACAYYRMEVPHRFLVWKKLAVGALGLLTDPLLYTHMEDICVIQRQYSPSVFGLIEAKHTLGIPVVGELDDNMWALTPDNPSYEVYHSGSIEAKRQQDRRDGKLAPGMNYLPTRTALADFYRAVDAITVPCEPLAAVLRKYNPRVYVLPNYIDDSILSSYPPPDPPRKTIRILWSGSHSHQDELIPSFRAIQRLMSEDSRIVFVYVGAPHRELPNFPAGRLDFYPPTQYVPQYYWLMSHLPAQIAIAPLNDSTFNHSKSWLKGLEYGAWGYYPILQDSPAYAPLKQIGVKDLAGWVQKNTESCWYEALKEAISDPAECLRRATLYQQAILSQCRFSQHCGEWLEVYKDVLSKPLNRTNLAQKYQNVGVANG
jgi:hypothetical protein